MPCPPPQITRSACASRSSWRPSPTTAHGGSRQIRTVQPRHHQPRHRRAAPAPGTRQSRAASASPSVPVNAVDGATTTTGPEPGGMTAPARSARSAADPPARPRPASPAAEPPGRAASRSAGAAGRDRLPANRFRRAPPRAGAAPARQDRAVSARIVASRNRPRTPGARRQPAADRRQPLRRQVQRMRVELDPRDPQQLGRHPAAGGDDVGHHQVGRQVAQGCGTLSTAIRAARWWILAPASRSSSSGGRSSPASSTASTPAARAVSSHSAPVSRVGLSPAGGETLAQRDGRKRVPGIRPGDHGDAHRPYPATAARRHAA